MICEIKKRPDPTRKKTPAMMASTLTIFISWVLAGVSASAEGKVTVTGTVIGTGAVEGLLVGTAGC